ncbi:MAG: hypothetical protein ACFB51_19945 [Anaerolineae bacterium]
MFHTSQAHDGDFNWQPVNCKSPASGAYDQIRVTVGAQSVDN